MAKVVGLSWWSLAIVIFASLVVGQLLHLGEQQLEVPISAMLVLAVTGQTQAAAQTRILETLVGAVTGVAVALLGPPVYVQRAGDAISNLAEDMTQLLEAMGEELTDGWSGEQARGWVRRTHELDGPLHSAETALARGEDSLRLNPRRRRVLEGTLSLRAGLAALEHSAVQVRGICRDLADLAERIEQRGRPNPRSWSRSGGCWSRWAAAWPPSASSSPPTWPAPRGRRCPCTSRWRSPGPIATSSPS